MTAFTNERALVDDFVQCLENRSDAPSSKVLREFFYHRGRADVVALDDRGDIVATEAKLSRWRDALHQAYRNTCFAHWSFVLLPQKTAMVAARFTNEFERRGIGLCTMVEGNLVIILEGRKHTPVQPWLSDEAVKSISSVS